VPVLLQKEPEGGQKVFLPGPEPGTFREVQPKRAAATSPRAATVPTRRSNIVVPVGPVKSSSMRAFTPVSIEPLEELSKCPIPMTADSMRADRRRRTLLQGAQPSGSAGTGAAASSEASGDVAAGAQPSAAGGRAPAPDPTQPSIDDAHVVYFHDGAPHRLAWWCWYALHVRRNKYDGSCSNDTLLAAANPGIRCRAGQLPGGASLPVRGGTAQVERIQGRGAQAPCHACLHPQHPSGQLCAPAADAAGPVQHPQAAPAATQGKRLAPCSYVLMRLVQVVVMPVNVGVAPGSAACSRDLAGLSSAWRPSLALGPVLLPHC
jgi:hypothetical protein